MGYSSGTKVGTEWHSGNVGTPVLFGNFGRIVAQSDGVWTLFNNAQNGFTRLQFGGTSNLFVSLVTSGAIALACQLANGSGYAGFYAGDFRAAGASPNVAAGVISYGGTVATTVGAAGAAAALPATPVGYIIINVAGTQMKIPYYNT